VRASISDVWVAIKDPAVHVAWHPFLTGIDGEHVLGATRTCSVTVGGKQGTTRECCVAEEQERTISWASEEDSTGFSRMVSDWRADALGVLPAEGVVGEAGDAAQGVLDDGDLEQRSVRPGGFGELTDVGEIIDQLRRDTAAVVAHDQRVPELDAEDVRRDRRARRGR
jgi:hypothetical protein